MEEGAMNETNIKRRAQLQHYAGPDVQDIFHTLQTEQTYSRQNSVQV